MKTKLTNNLKLGKTYLFMGYNWTVCELVNDGRTAVLQSHGVTSGAWPGFKMAEFGNGDYYADSIDGQDISVYDHKLKELYNAIKDVEDKSATYGKGLYLVSKEKVGFTKCGEHGSGYYCTALKEAAMNYQSFGAASNGAWLGTVSGSGNPLCVDSNGGVYNGNLRSSGFVVAPAFNLDLSKVEVAGDEIVIKKESTGQLENQLNSAPYRSIWEYGMDFTKDGETFHLDPEMVRQIFEAITEDNGRNYVATYTSRKFTREQYIAICDEVENLLTNDSVEYRACEHVLGEGFDKTETWIIKSMFTANHESRTVEHPETFSSEQEAWNRVKSLVLADQDDKEVAEVRYNKDACEAMVIYSDKTFCKFFAEKTDTPETLPLDGNTWGKQKAATLELGKTYRLAGYKWTACELINNGKTLVLQSHGVTSGAWPGFVMPQFGNGNYYTNSIDGEDISAYDNKMKELYDAIKDVEDTSASYGNGLYLVSREKAGFTEWGKSGSGNYWQALKEAAGNARSFGASSNGAWLGTVSGSCNPLCVDSNGGVYNSNLRNSGFVVAPAFNLDLSKVEVAGDEIVIKETYEKTNTGSLALEKRVKKARLILAVTEQVSEDNFERHYKTVEIEVPKKEHMNLSKCDIIGGEWIS